MNKLDHLTGLRAIAAYCVLFNHSVDIAFNYTNAPSYFHNQVVCFSYFGMSLFFVLSGFVITYNYVPKFRSSSWVRATYEFTAARFARLYPLYFVALLITVQYLPSPTLHSPEQILAYGTLTQSWFNLHTATFVPAWSRSAPNGQKP